MTTATYLSSATLTDRQARELLCDLCRRFYELGWASGTGGGISVKSGDRIFMAPSGVQKERLRPNDVFVLDEKGEVVEKPEGNLAVSACRPLFMHAYQLRGAGAVLHSHSLNALMATLLSDDSFKITGIEMQKGIRGVGVFDVHEVPIIENTAQECELADSLKEAILAYPKSDAVLVRGHGVYVWGKNWIQAKTQAECYDYLFAAAVQMKQFGIDPAKDRRR
jgi:methylthioribulose-1-phosphate dehydratase